MKALFDKASIKSSKLVTSLYSTSFSLGIRFLTKRFRDPIYAIYGFVRFADEIVDSFHEYDKSVLLREFRSDTYEAIDRRISLNPILNSFQHVVNEYNIERELIDAFLDSMEMDLHKTGYDQSGIEQYILGSAEVVGLMCLRVFTENDKLLYDSMKHQAMKLGAAFQKINFLRDMKADFVDLGRTYFPNVDMDHMDDRTKHKIEKDIMEDFEEGLRGIRKLPKDARFGVYVAYIYYYALFQKIKSTNASRILNERIRISNERKIALLFTSYLRHSLNLL